MGDLGAIHEDVRFNWAAAADLAAEHRLRGAVREAADDLDELVRLAREEQQRRLQAREWQRRQDSENWVERNLVDPILSLAGRGRSAVADPPARARD